MYPKTSKPSTSTSMNFIYDCDLKQLEKLAKDILVFTSKSELSEKLAYSLNLCLDEVLTNIISYGFKDCPAKPIQLELIKAQGIVTAKISDSGIAFNPLKDAPRKTAKPLETLDERNIGGLGVYFLHKYMDQIMYERIENQNILTLIVKTT